jgi:hypothetical protein
MYLEICGRQVDAHIFFCLESFFQILFCIDMANALLNKNIFSNSSLSILISLHSNTNIFCDCLREIRRHQKSTELLIRKLPALGS